MQIYPASRVVRQILFLLLSLGFALNATSADQDIDQLYQELAVVSSQRGVFDEKLVSILHSLAETHYQRGETPQARDNAERAQHIIHRTHGVYAKEQLPVLDLLHQISLSEYNIESATNALSFRYQVLQKAFGPYHSDTITGLIEFANWEIAIANYEPTKLMLSNFLNQYDATGRQPNKQLAKVHNLIAEIQYLEGECCSDHLTQEALDLVMNDASSDLAEKQSAIYKKMDFDLMAGRSVVNLVDGVDEHILTESQTSMILGLSRHDRVVRAYRSISQDISLLMSAPGALRGKPFAFCSARLDHLVSNDTDLFVHAELKISDEGRLKNVRIIDSNAPKPLLRLFKKIAEANRYRPKLEQGHPVESVLEVHQDFVSDVSLEREFNPAGVADVHACHMVAQDYQRPGVFATVQ